LSCKHAYFIANEVINYYRQNGSSLNVVCLDASKAFDKLWRDGLFFKLIINIPKPLWRILYKYYSLSKIIVKHEGKLGDSLNITEGVKQGGILSPHLFNYFINELLVQCTQLDIGAKISHMNLSIIAYCDDIMIMSPSIGQCHKILEVCESYSKIWKIDFNANKSVALIIQKKITKDCPSFKLNKAEIPIVNNTIYLGLPFGDNKFISEYFEEKWKKVEKSFYFLYGLGCKAKMSSPDLIAFFKISNFVNQFLEITLI